MYTSSIYSSSHNSSIRFCVDVESKKKKKTKSRRALTHLSRFGEQRRPLAVASRAAAAMKGDRVRRGKEEALGAGGGQLCPECGYEYPNANPNPRLRRSHSKNCRRKMKMPVVAEEAGVAVHKRRRGLAVENASECGSLLGISLGY